MLIICFFSLFSFFFGFLNFLIILNLQSILKILIILIHHCFIMTVQRYTKIFTCAEKTSRRRLWAVSDGKVTIISHRWEIMGKGRCIPLENP